MVSDRSGADDGVGCRRASRQIGIVGLLARRLRRQAGGEGRPKSRHHPTPALSHDAPPPSGCPRRGTLLPCAVPRYGTRLDWGASRTLAAALGVSIRGGRSCTSSGSNCAAPTSEPTPKSPQRPRIPSFRKTRFERGSSRHETVRTGRLGSRLFQRANCKYFTRHGRRNRQASSGRHA
jgi:hypothetical protein